MKCDRSSVALPVPSLSVSFNETLDARSAGARPKARPVNTVKPKLKTKTCQSRPIGASVGRSGEMNVSSRPVPQRARPKPISPPIKANSMLSVISCRTMRALPAPTASRIAISFCRITARESNRFATLAQAMSSRKPTALRKSSNDLLAPAVTSSCQVETMTLFVMPFIKVDRNIVSSSNTKAGLSVRSRAQGQQCTENSLNQETQLWHCGKSGLRFDRSLANATLFAFSPLTRTSAPL